jgi:hypothetical protein
MDKYIDPSNSDDIIEKIKTLPTLGDIKNLADEIFPGWIVRTVDSYSTDYQWLTENWKHTCSKIGVERKQIMLVDFINFEDQYSVLQMFSETFTRSGFNVRSSHEYMLCSKCDSVIPNQYLMNIFMEKGFLVPKEWSPICSVCN